MKVLHLATSLSGGAGIAARRICEAQVNEGMDSRILGGQVSANYILKPHENVQNGDIKEKIGSSITTVFQRYALQNSSKLITSLSINRLEKEAKQIEDYDLVHVHANYNFISLENIIAISNRKATVITLHDQRYFTGGCHYSFECQGFIKSCINCPQVRKSFRLIPNITLKKSIESFNKMKRIELIAPSHWMANLAAKSQVLKDKNIWTVMNPVPNVFNPRQNQNLNAKVLKIGFVSENLNNPYKGLDVLLSAIRLIENRVNIELRLFGNGKVVTNSIKSVVVQKQFENEIDASEAYNSCDVIIVPSIQDNFPSVITEALSCGVPVIGSNTGGISEVLKMFGLPIFEPGDSIALANQITNFESPENKKHYSRLANQHFSYKTSADKHESIYREILRQ